MTVASMPMASDVARSMPAAGAGGPPPDVAAPDHHGELEIELLACARRSRRPRRSTTAASMVSSEADEASASPRHLQDDRAAGHAHPAVLSRRTTTWANCAVIGAGPRRWAMVCFSSWT